MIKLECSNSFECGALVGLCDPDLERIDLLYSSSGRGVNLVSVLLRYPLAVTNTT